MQSKEEKRKKAEAMLTAWRSLTPEAQIASLEARRGESKKQIARIREKMGKGKK